MEILKVYVVFVNFEIISPICVTDAQNEQITHRSNSFNN